MMIVAGFAIAGVLFVVSAVAGEKHALWIPAILLLAAAGANALL